MEPVAGEQARDTLANLNERIREIGERPRDILDFAGAIERQARELRLDAIAKSRERQIPDRVLSIMALALALFRQELPAAIWDLQPEAVDAVVDRVREMARRAGVTPARWAEALASLTPEQIKRAHDADEGSAVAIRMECEFVGGSSDAAGAQLSGGSDGSV